MTKKKFNGTILTLLSLILEARDPFDATRFSFTDDVTPRENMKCQLRVRCKDGIVWFNEYWMEAYFRYDKDTLGFVKNTTYFISEYAEEDV